MKRCLVAVVFCSLACSPQMMTNMMDAGADGGARFQGPVNPDFETAGSPADVPDGWSVTGAYTGGACPAFSDYPRPRRITGTSFMPTNGTQYLTVQTSGAGVATASQDLVNLDRSTTLTFDYELSGQLGGEATANDITVELLYTSSGTSTLWQRQFTHQTGSAMMIPKVSKRDEVVTFTSFPNAGRLLLRITETCNAAGGVAVSGTGFSFSIDHLRVQ